MFLGTDNTKMLPKAEDRKFFLDWTEVYRYLPAPWKIKARNAVTGIKTMQCMTHYQGNILYSYEWAGCREENNILLANTIESLVAKIIYWDTIVLISIILSQYNCRVWATYNISYTVKSIFISKPPSQIKVNWMNLFQCNQP